MEANPFKLKKELPLLPGYIIVVLWTAFIFCMIGWIILASLSTTKEIFTGSLLASGLHFENYTKALFTNKAALNLLNSVIYTVPSCILIIVVCAPAAYCMSRFKFRGAGLIQALIIIGLAIPNIMIVMPLFSIVSALNLSGTLSTAAARSSASGKLCSLWLSLLLLPCLSLTLSVSGTNTSWL